MAVVARAQAAADGDVGPASTIDLARNAPPTPPSLAADLRSGLDRARARLEARLLMNGHRYGGTPADRESAARWLSRRFGPRDLAGRIVLTNGTMNAVQLALSALVEPGALVVTEQPGVLHAWPLAQIVGARVTGLPIDDEGLIAEAFEEVCRRDRPRVLFCVPTLHNPTTAIMSLERRRRIVEIAARHGVSIIEDDICGLLPLQAPPPMASLSPAITWYATGLNKSVSPGLRIGYLVAPSAAAAEGIVARFKSTSTWFAAPLSAELAIAWIGDGTAFRALSFIQEESAARQKLAARLLGAADIVAKPEALQIWLRLLDDCPVDAFAEQARRRGVVIGPGGAFMPAGSGPVQAVRVCLGAAASARELGAALSILADVHP